MEYICEICNKTFKNCNGLSIHIKRIHNLTSQEYYDTFLKESDEGFCKKCGNPTPYKNLNIGYKKYCCRYCAITSDESREKTIKSNREKYGTDWPTQNKEVSKKISETKQNYSEERKQEINDKRSKTYENRFGKGIICGLQVDEYREKGLKKFKEETGYDYYTQDPNVQEKIKNTCREKYNKDWYMQTEEFKEKSKETNLKNYGEEKPFTYGSNTFKNLMIDEFGVGIASKNPDIAKKISEAQSEFSQEKRNNINTKIKNTCRERYNYDSNSQTPEHRKYMSELMSSKLSDPVEGHKIRQKQAKTRLKNGKRSQSECRFKEILDKLNISYIEEFKSEEYPYFCDFYLDKYNLYVELNIFWTHGKHFFNKDNKQDLKVLKKWQDKKFDVPIDVWTNTDLEKRETAIKNKLNYLVIWNDRGINKIEKIFENTGLKNLNDFPLDQDFNIFINGVMNK